MLVIIDNLSRWVHITPLRSLKASVIADALIECFSYMGIPQVIRMDNMPAFKSELFKAVRDKLGIDAKFSAPMHYESHGRVERVQATIESMIKKFAHENPSNWDQLIPYLLFALEVPYSATGFSPAEMVMGRKMRGPLQVVRDTWSNDCDDPCLLYTSDAADE